MLLSSRYLILITKKDKTCNNFYKICGNSDKPISENSNIFYDLNLRLRSNYQGTSGEMEVEGAMTVFHRSLQHYGVRYADCGSM